MNVCIGQKTYVHVCMSVYVSACESVYNRKHSSAIACAHACMCVSVSVCMSAYERVYTTENIYPCLHVYVRSTSCGEQTV